MDFGLISNKKINSFSKLIHEKISDINYDLHELKEDKLDEFFTKRDFKGLNVTIPYKEKVIPYLDFIEESAKKIGAVNTIVNKNGKLTGYNTDYYGFEYLLKYFKIDIKDQVVMILGSGGASKCIATLLKDLNSKKVIIVSRNPISNMISYDEISNYQETSIVINTTPVGMSPNINENVFDFDKLNNLKVAIDVVYNPLNTLFMMEAKKRKIASYGGLMMLIAQAVKANELFTGKKYLEEMIATLYLDFKKQLTSIALIGLSYSGKSTIGKELAKTLDKSFIDIDKEIEHQEEIAIKDIFKINGESYFRNLEFETIKKYAVLNNQVISLGGGAVMNPLNMTYIKSNCVVVYIKRPFKFIKFDDSRPLSTNIEQLNELEIKRKEIYEHFADIIINNDSTIIDAIIRVKEAYYAYFSN
jgi:shikimate dehydrogenase